MIIRRSRFYSVFAQKCPRCQEGNMFSSSVFSPRFTHMHSNCPVCGFDLVQEPSFYFGAMYFSYAFQVAVFVAVYLLLRYTINPDTWTYVGWMILGSVAILPWNYRMSRAAWISLFVAPNRQQ